MTEEQKKRVEDSLKKIEGKKRPVISEEVADFRSHRDWKEVKPSDEETPVLDSPVKELREGLGNKMALIDFSAAEEGGIVKTPAEALLHIVAERNILDITQKEMAEHLGMGVVNYSNIERGNTPLSLPNFFKICDKLNLKITIQ